MWGLTVVCQVYDQPVMSFCNDGGTVPLKYWDLLLSSSTWSCEREFYNEDVHVKPAVSLYL